MTGQAFERMLAMSALEALRLLRRRRQEWSNSTVAEIMRQMEQIDGGAVGLDIDAGLELDRLVRTAEGPGDGAAFYRLCIFDIIVRMGAPWARAIRLGRGRLLSQLSRDQIQCFRSAGLLDETPNDDVVRWWDDLSSAVRASATSEALCRGRRAERLTIEYERVRLGRLGITLEPRWVAIEDNTVGYDVLSYDVGEKEPLNRLVEVKSTIVSPLRFYVSRNEWEQAVAAGCQYHFHVWDLGRTPPALYQLTQAEVNLHIPQDSGLGKWDTAIIPVGIPTEANYRVTFSQAATVVGAG